MRHRVNAWRWISMLALACLIIPVWAIAAPVGTITHVEGNVDLTAIGKAARDVFKGEPVSEGDILRAKSHSKAEVTFNDGNILRLAENTRVRISSYQIGEGKQSSVDLSRGKVQSIVKNLLKNSRYEVHTPTAICGVRGTDFFVFFQNGISGATPREGTIYVYNPKFPTAVTAVTVGQGAIIGNTDQPPVLQPASETDMDNNLKDTSPTEKPPLTDETTPPQGTLLQPPLLNTGESLSQLDYFNETPPGAPPLTPNNDIIDNGVIGGAFVTDINLFTQTQTSAVSGRLTISTANDMYLYGNIMDYQNPAIGGIDGSATDGTHFTGYIGGIPGSWSGLFRSVYLQGQNVGYATADLSGGFSGGIVTARGTFTLNTALGIAGSSLQSFTLPLPVFENIDTSGNIIVEETSPSVIVGYRTSTGKIVSVWGLLNPTSIYRNDGATSLTCGAFGTSASSGRPFFMLGSSSLSENPVDQKLEVLVDGSIQYLDTAYLGSIDLSYRGTYGQTVDVSGQHSGANIGAGTYTLDPLDFNGGFTMSSLLYNSISGVVPGLITAGNASGLAGGLRNLIGGSQVQVDLLGQYSIDAGFSSPYLFDAIFDGAGKGFSGQFGLNATDPAKTGFYNGYLVGLWNGGLIESEDALVLYVNNANHAGYIDGNLSGKYYSSLGMWEAQGKLQSVDKGSTALTPSTISYTNGDFSGLTTLDATNSSLSGAMIGLSDQSWGIWKLSAGGATGTAGTFPTSASAGGDITFNSDTGYWISGLAISTPSVDRLAATLSGNFLTDRVFGNLNTTGGGILGAYDASKWEVIGVGLYDYQPLYFSSIAGNGSTFQLTNSGGWGFLPNPVFGIMGGTGDLWANQGTTTFTALQFIGKMSFDFATSPILPVFRTEMASFDPSVSMDPLVSSRTPVNAGGRYGAYFAFLGGNNNSQNALNGVVQGMYLNDNNEIGIIYGTASGTSYPNIGMWNSIGSVKTYVMDTQNLSDKPGWTPVDFYSNLNGTRVNENNTFSTEIASEPVTLPYTVNLGILNTSTLNNFSLALTNQSNFALFSGVLGGTYTGTPFDVSSGSSSWTWAINDPTPILSARSQYVSVLIDQSANNAFSGNIASGAIDWTSATTYVSGGVIKGTFDPVTTSTWNAVMAGISMETAAFLNKVNPMNAAARATFEQATKIPAFEVGSVDLSGSAPYGTDTLSVGMTNVKFFAFTTDQNNPRIWATKDISGSYGNSSGALPPVGTSVPLTTTSGGNIPSTFTVQNWNTGQWAATVNGFGGLNAGTGSLNVNMKGAAAGTYTLNTGVPGGTITGGTASGSTHP